MGRMNTARRWWPRIGCRRRCMWRVRRSWRIWGIRRTGITTKSTKARRATRFRGSIEQADLQRAEYQPRLHAIAVLTACATFPLIFMGGLVTSHGAGMSAPDWPNSYGYNMFLFPPRLWIGGVLYEHTHRLMGTVVGMLSIALCVVGWRVEMRRWVRWLCAGVLGAVIFQGV